MQIMHAPAPRDSAGVEVCGGERGRCCCCWLTRARRALCYRSRYVVWGKGNDGWLDAREVRSSSRRIPIARAAPSQNHGSCLVDVSMWGIF